jgi:branched-chain amino acid transport system ATP-binding protein
MAELLHLDGLVKRFGGLTATDGVTLDVTEGEIHALIGPNGAGKTTLIHQIAGSLAPDAGRIRFNGVDVTRMSLHLRTQLGLARSYQVVSLFPRPLGTRQPRVGRAGAPDAGSSFRFWRAVRSQTPLFDEARELSRRGRDRRTPRRASPASSRTASSGRSNSAMALATRPRLLLLDEPMAGLGPEESARMVELIERLARQVTMLLVEHDMDAVFRFADRISVLVNGRMIATGTADVVRADAQVRRAYLGDHL